MTTAKIEVQRHVLIVLTAIPVITVPLTFHKNRWGFSVGPGIEIPDHDHDNEFVFRVASEVHLEPVSF